MACYQDVVALVRKKIEDMKDLVKYEDNSARRNQEESWYSDGKIAGYEEAIADLEEILAVLTVADREDKEHAEFEARCEDQAQRRGDSVHDQ